MEERAERNAVVRTAAAREQRGVEREGRVLCGGPDERDGALLDMRQKRILLRLVETVNFIQKEDGASSREALRTGRSFDALPDVRDTTRNGRETLEDAASGVLLHHGSKRGLSAAWRPPENERRERTVCQKRREGGQCVVLSDEFVQPSWSHALRKRRGGRAAPPYLGWKLTLAGRRTLPDTDRRRLCLPAGRLVMGVPTIPRCGCRARRRLGLTGRLQARVEVVIDQRTGHLFGAHGARDEGRCRRAGRVVRTGHSESERAGVA